MGITYDDLDINQKINLKGVLEDWSRIAVERFRKSLTRNVYTTSTKRGKRRTRRLFDNWQRNTFGDASSLSGGVVLKFLMYGRYVDWGVGGTVSSTDREVNQKLGLGRGPRTKRQPKRWLGPTRSKEVGALRRIVVKRFGMIIAESVQNSLSITVPVKM